MLKVLENEFIVLIKHSPSFLQFKVLYLLSFLCAQCMDEELPSTYDCVGL